MFAIGLIFWHVQHHSAPVALHRAQAVVTTKRRAHTFLASSRPTAPRRFLFSHARSISFDSAVVP
jgi:hypothetical protein